MAELAESTGGFLIANTNDTAKPMHRVMEDVRAHYELSYVPTSQNYDGHFRKIEVLVKRPGAQVHTRADISPCRYWPARYCNRLKWPRSRR
jgi:VWFA-related protein